MQLRSPLGSLSDLKTVSAVPQENFCLLENSDFVIFDRKNILDGGPVSLVHLEPSSMFAFYTRYQFVREQVRLRDCRKFCGEP